MRRILVPMLALGLLSALLWWTPWKSESPLHDVRSDVSVCRDRLRAIYAGLVEYEAQHGAAPQFKGGAFLGALIGKGTWEDSAASHRLLQCPGSAAESKEFSWTSGATGEELRWSTSYTLADFQAFPLQAFPAGGPQLRAIVACNNAKGMNHVGALNVLYTDGSVKTLMLKQLIEQGILPEDALEISLGPDSPLEELRSLIAP